MTEKRQEKGRLALAGRWLFSFGVRLLERIRHCALWNGEHRLERAHESRFRFRPFDHFRVRFHNSIMPLFVQARCKFLHEATYIA